MKHLEGIGYWRHMYLAAKWSYTSMTAGVLGFIHAVIPHLWQNILSKSASKIDGDLKKEKRRISSRKQGARRARRS